MSVVGFRVAGLSKAQHLGLRRLRRCVNPSQSTVAVSERGHALLPVSREHASGVAYAHPHKGCGLVHSHVPRQQDVEHPHHGSIDCISAARF